MGGTSEKKQMDGAPAFVFKGVLQQQVGQHEIIPCLLDFDGGIIHATLGDLIFLEVFEYSNRGVVGIDEPSIQQKICFVVMEVLRFRDLKIRLGT